MSANWTFPNMRTSRCFVMPPTCTTSCCKSARNGSQKARRCGFTAIGSRLTRTNRFTPERTYQIRGGKRFNALKYVNIYYHSKHMDRGDTDGQFLGL